MMGKGPVIGIGAATWDHFYVVDQFPSDEGVTEAKASHFGGGGPVATALCAMARMGLPTVLLDAQGDDAIGTSIRSELAAYGMDVSRIRVETGASSPHAVVLVRVSDAARNITYFPSTAKPLGVDDVPEVLFTNASLLHLNGRHEEAARHAVALAKKHGVPVSFDGGAGRYRESIRDLVLASEVRIVAREFADKFTGLSEVEAQGMALLDDTAQVVVITDGVRGSYVWSREGECFHQPAFTGLPVIDTTGCGDVYHGVFLGRWVRELPLTLCADAASTLAASNAAALGGRFAVPLASSSTRSC
ncbi:MAG: carbohydrate kinase family protein [Verrucomicrobiaceae bacterium]|jgi:sugar/nucleoside kinase (ribokinase family)